VQVLDCKMHENAISLEQQETPADIQKVIDLYKQFDRYADNTEEELYHHVLPSFQLNQCKIHYDNGELIGFTNWAFLSSEAEQRYLKTTELEPSDWNSGPTAWHIDTVCKKNINKIMAWTKTYFKNLLNVGEGLNWIRINKDGKITRCSVKYKREFHG